MNINGYEIPKHLIESYLRACRYNQIVGTYESDKMQEDVHKQILVTSGLTPGDNAFDGFTLGIMQLVNDLLKEGY